MHLAASQGKFPYHEGKHLIVVVELHAYADESGIHSRTGYCVVSGYIGSPRQWKYVKKEWSAILSKFRVPAFHAIDFFSPQRRAHRDYYAAWSDRRAREFLNNLLDIIRARQIHPVGGAIKLKDFYALSEVERRLMTGGDARLLSKVSYIRQKSMTKGAPNRPYTLGFVLLVLEALDYAKNGVRVHFTFDRQNVYEGWARQAYADVLANPELLAANNVKGLLGNLTYASSEQEEPLQVADLHAYVWNSYLTRGAAITVDRFQALAEIARKRSSMRIFDASGFERILNTIKEQARARGQIL